MSPEPVDRRDFLAGAGGLFLCTLAGHKVFLDKPADLPKLAAGVPVPPKVAAAARSRSEGGARSSRRVRRPAQPDAREYWIQAEPANWNIVPTGRDEMMDKKVKGKTKFTAYAYRRYTPNSPRRSGPATIPGPLIEAEVGDTIVVHFRNKLNVPVTIHPHGVFYAQEMDGAYKGKFTDPGGFVQRNRTFTYVWEARARHRGHLALPRPRADGPDPALTRGCSGPLIIRDPAGRRRPTRSSSSPSTPSRRSPPTSDTQFACINGRAYAGNTPTLASKVGRRGRLPRDRDRQRLPHLPRPRPPLGGPERDR